jgi:biopolymer transport protein ExbD
MAFSFSSGNRGRRGGSAMAEINVTPFVDVLLVLLIIFMITAHVMEFGAEVDVPKTKSVKESNKDLAIITITKTGLVTLNKDEVNINTLPSLIKEKFDAKKGVYLRADKETQWDPIAKIMAALGDASIPINVVTQPEEKAR